MRYGRAAEGSWREVVFSWAAGRGGAARAGGTTPDKPDVLSATGTCRFGNPMQGPMTVSCEGRLSSGGAFSATFTTDGKPPT